MPYSVELRLRVEELSDTPRITGYHLYSFFLRLIEGANQNLSARLHDSDGAKPFTLFHVPSRQPLSRGSLVSLRVTLLGEEVFAHLLDALWRLPAGQLLPLGSLTICCNGIATTPSQSLLADFATFEDILGDAREERRIRLRFLSPTTFRSKGRRNILFPEPSLVFGSLLSRWNTFAPSALRLTLGESTESAMRVSGYKLGTGLLDFGTYQETGFRGEVTYEIAESAPADEVRMLQALASFAFFSGTGAKTTMGMGQTRRVANARSASNRTGLDRRHH